MIESVALLFQYQQVYSILVTVAAAIAFQISKIIHFILLFSRVSQSEKLCSSANCSAMGPVFLLLFRTSKKFRPQKFRPHWERFKQIWAGSEPKYLWNKQLLRAADENVEYFTSYKTIFFIV